MYNRFPSEGLFYYGDWRTLMKSEKVLLVVVYYNLPNAYRYNQYNLYSFRFFRASVSVVLAHNGIKITKRYENWITMPPMPLKRNIYVFLTR